jgi:hypothetical protein
MATCQFREALNFNLLTGHVNEAKNALKLCDFSNAMFAGKNEITP